MLPKYKWAEIQADDGAVSDLVRSLGLSAPVARVLVARGVATPEAADTFLHPELNKHLGDPFAFPGARAAAERLWDAIGNGRDIVVFGDFDADGVAATTVLTTALRRLGGRADAFLPVREPEGYGLTFAALERCRSEHGGWPALLVTVDCGIGSVAEVAYLNAQGVEVIITDHHEPGTELPQAAVLVNPQLGASPGAEHLCGAGVAFKVAHAMAELGKANGWYGGEPFCGELLTPVGLATVADVVPLTGENRVFVTAALKHWNRFAGEGLRALLSRAAGQVPEELDTHLFGFVLGPRINAAGRMGSAMDAYELLTTRDRQRAAELATKLEGFNGERRGVESRMLAAARLQCGLNEQTAGTFGEAAVVVHGDEGWHPGVLGIVAARLSDAAARPAAVVAFGKSKAGRGSVRAGEGYHAVEALAAASEALAGFGGHARAAGFQIKPDCFERFKELFCAACAGQAAANGGAQTLQVDGWLEAEQISLALYREQQRLAPFGIGNPAPRWGLRGVALERVQPMGQSGEHMQLLFRVAPGCTLRGVWFRNGSATEAVRTAGGRVDVVFELRQNGFGGEPAAELQVVDLAPARVP